MRNLKITLEYDGRHYCGWQAQKLKFKTIQLTLEKTLYRILRQRVKVIGSGRTDSGVHAVGQVANFWTDSSIPIKKLHSALNALLPSDIVVTEIEEVAADFHATKSAASKIYRYLILNRPYPSALLKDRVYFYRSPLDLKLMRKETQCLIGRHDFRAFCASGSGARSTARTIKKVSIKKISYHPFLASSQVNGYSLIAIDIEADGFLYNMVRSIVGTLIDIGRGRLTKGALKKLLLSRDRKRAGTTAPAGGLYLLEVKY